jgi:hypothetical protein
MPRFYPDPDACDPDDKNLWVCGDPERKNELFQRAVYLRKVHGILAAVAVGVWLVGAVLPRLWKPKKVQSKGEGKKKKRRTGEGEKKEKKGGVYRLYAHMVLQMVGLVLFVAAAGIGFWLLDVVEIPGGGLVSCQVLFITFVALDYPSPRVRLHPQYGSLTPSSFATPPRTITPSSDSSCSASFSSKPFSAFSSTVASRASSAVSCGPTPTCSSATWASSSVSSMALSASKSRMTRVALFFTQR